MNIEELRKRYNKVVKVTNQRHDEDVMSIEEILTKASRCERAAGKPEVLRELHLLFQEQQDSMRILLLLAVLQGLAA